MRWRIPECLIVLSIAAFSTSGNTQSTRKDSAELAQDLVRLLRYERQMETYRKDCENSARTVSPESLVKANPNQLGGSTPASRNWPKIVAAYEQYYREICARPTMNEFLTAMSQQYSADVSVPDLEAAIAFYSTPSGQRLTDAHRNTSALISAMVARSYAVEVPKAVANLNRRIEEIAAEEDAYQSRCPALALVVSDPMGFFRGLMKCLKLA